MTLSHALQEISEAYMPGTVAFYRRQNPDLWQHAHDELEKWVLHGDPLLLETAVGRFLSRCLELLARFKREGSPSGPLSMADAFVLGDPVRVDAWGSVREHVCAKCLGRAHLKIVPTGLRGVDVMLLCRNCL
jgi:hypothetical protein